jgi:hypothetical protein
MAVKMTLRLLPGILLKTMFLRSSAGVVIGETD